MGDRIAVLKDGVLQQVGTPRDLYETAEQRVRRRLHRLARDEPVPRRPRRRRHQVRHRGRAGRPRHARRCATAKTVTIGVRPEDISVAPDGEGLAGRGRPRRGARRRRLPLRPHRRSTASASTSSRASTAASHPNAGDKVFILPRAAPRARLRHRVRACASARRPSSRASSTSIRHVGPHRFRRMMRLASSRGLHGLVSDERLTEHHLRDGRSRRCSTCRGTSRSRPGPTRPSRAAQGHLPAPGALRHLGGHVVADQGDHRRDGQARVRHAAHPAATRRAVRRPGRGDHEPDG